MAFGFSPKYVKTYHHDGLKEAHFLVLAIEAALNLKWNVSFKSESGFIAYTNFSWRSYSEEITVKKVPEGITIKSECNGIQLIDWGKNKENVEALISEIELVKNTLSAETIASKIETLRETFAAKKDDILNQPPSTAKDKLTGFFSIFTPTQGYFISPLLLSINMLIFIGMVISGVHLLLPESQDLLDWGANFHGLTLEGQWWRLLTACFVHIGILHLVFNMYALVYIGLLLEPYLGKTRFFMAYLISGIAASITSLWWHDLIISAGASGAIFGLYGVFLALLTTDLIDKSAKKALVTSIVVFVVFNILNGLQPNSGIDNAAHIGGLLCGLIIGYAFIPSLKQFENKVLKLSTIAALSAVLFIASFSIYSALPKDLGKYDRAMERFVSMELIALEVYSLPEGTPNEEILSELEDRGLYYWKENIKLLDSFKDLDLPLSIRNRNLRLREYCELRIKSYELIYKAIKKDTDAYQNEINAYGEEIEAIIAELSGG